MDSQAFNNDENPASDDDAVTVRDDAVSELLNAVSAPDHSDSFWDTLTDHCRTERQAGLGIQDQREALSGLNKEAQAGRMGAVGSYPAGTEVRNKTTGQDPTQSELAPVTRLRAKRTGRRSTITQVAASVVLLVAVGGALFAGLRMNMDPQELTSEPAITDQRGSATQPTGVDQLSEPNEPTTPSLDSPSTAEEVGAQPEPSPATDPPESTTTTTTTTATLPTGESIAGQRGITLQWLETAGRGSVTLTPLGDQVYAVSGGQVEPLNDGYLTIEGTITKRSDLELAFEGTIGTKVFHSNNGEPCIRQVSSTFLSTRGRQYWRLQALDNPCDDHADYIDIYFD